MRKSVTAVLAFFVLALSACSAAPSAQAVNKAVDAVPTITATTEAITGAAATPQSSAAQAQPAESQSDAPENLPPDQNQVVTDEQVALKLAVGTLKLQGTDQAITADQAGALETLWKEYQALAESQNPQAGEWPENGQPPTSGQDPAAQATPDATAVAAAQLIQDQLSAVLDKIKAAMTEEQLKAIDELQITQETMQTILSDLGIPVSGPGGKDGNGGPGGGQPPSGDAGQAVVSQGTPPAAPDGSGGNTPPQGMGGGRSMGLRLPNAVLDALLSALETIQS